MRRCPLGSGPSCLPGRIEAGNINDRDTSGLPQSLASSIRDMAAPSCMATTGLAASAEAMEAAVENEAADACNATGTTSTRGTTRLKVIEGVTVGELVPDTNSLLTVPAGDAVALREARVTDRLASHESDDDMDKVEVGRTVTLAVMRIADPVRTVVGEKDSVTVSEGNVVRDAVVEVVIVMRPERVPLTPGVFVGGGVIVAVFVFVGGGVMVAVLVGVAKEGLEVHFIVVDRVSTCVAVGAGITVFEKVGLCVAMSVREGVGNWVRESVGVGVGSRDAVGTTGTERLGVVSFDNVHVGVARKEALRVGNTVRVTVGLDVGMMVRVREVSELGLWVTL